jgi:hypothetical protein
VKELFGLPLDTVLAIVLGALAVVLSAVGLLALRNRVLVRLGVRNVGRRRARTALIVAGLMLGTTIIAAALTTGDTMSHSIRVTAVAVLGETDEIVAARGAVDDIPGELGAAVGTGAFDESVVQHVEQATRASGLVDGVAGAIVEQVALQAPETRQSEPSVVLFGADPAALADFSPILDLDGAPRTLDTLGPGELFLNAKAAEELRVARGRRRAAVRGTDADAVPRGRRGHVRRNRHGRRGGARDARRGAAPLRHAREGDGRARLQPGRRPRRRRAHVPGRAVAGAGRRTPRA